VLFGGSHGFASAIQLFAGFANQGYGIDLLILLLAELGEAPQSLVPKLSTGGDADAGFG
jgi:hypothetical protein